MNGATRESPALGADSAPSKHAPRKGWRPVERSGDIAFKSPEQSKVIMWRRPSSACSQSGQKQEMLSQQVLRRTKSDTMLAGLDSVAVEFKPHNEAVAPQVVYETEHGQFFFRNEYGVANQVRKSFIQNIPLKTSKLSK